ncbi:MAG: hypothetical protein VYE08_00275 [Candidatus Thermoplasmatota archaeon]|nr:hypothetical protein [Candidatus Thermoplasmatota archaeon]
MILNTSMAGNAVSSIDDGVVVASVFHVEDRRVHGPDADDLTVLIDALEAWRNGKHEGPVDLEVDDEERRILSASLPWLTMEVGAQHDAHRFQCGAAVLDRDASIDLAAVSVAAELRIAVEASAHDAITTPWSTESICLTHTMATSHTCRGSHES